MMTIRPNWGSLARQFLATVLPAACFGWTEGYVLLVHQSLELSNFLTLGLNQALVYAILLGLPLFVLTVLFGRNTSTKTARLITATLLLVLAGQVLLVVDVAGTVTSLLQVGLLMGVATAICLIPTVRIWLIIVIPFSLLSLGYGLVHYGSLPAPSISTGPVEKTPPIVWINFSSAKSNTGSREENPTPGLSPNERRDDFVQFENYYRTSPRPVPAVTSGLTGLYPLQHGKIRSARLHLKVVTLPQILNRVGYRTIGLSGDPSITTVRGFNRGFDRFYSSASLFRNSVLNRLLKYVLPRNYLAIAQHWFTGLINEAIRLPASENAIINTYRRELKNRLDTPSLFVYLHLSTPVTNKTRPTSTVLDALARQGLYKEALVIVTGTDNDTLPNGSPVSSSLLVKLPGSRFGGHSRRTSVDGVDIVPTVINRLGSRVSLDYDLPGEVIIDDTGPAQETSPPLIETYPIGSDDHRTTTVESGIQYVLTRTGKNLSRKAYRLDTGTAPKNPDTVNNNVFEKLLWITNDHLNFRYNSFDLTPRQQHQLRHLGYMN